MANMLGGFPVSVGGITFKNTGTADIPSNMAVRLSGDNQVALAVAAGAVTSPIGITVTIIQAGKSGIVRCLGAIECVAEGTVAAGDFVQLGNTAGKLGWVKTAGAAIPALGIAFNGAVDGGAVMVFVAQARNAL